jgi:integrase
VTRTKTLFRYAFDAELIDRPVRMGEFTGPPQRVLRAHKAKRGPLMFEPDELMRIINVAEMPLKVWVMLGINAAFGPADIGQLPLSALSKDGWVEFAREKTGLPRRAPLWAETAELIEEALAQRPRPADKAAQRLVFLQPDGKTWMRARGGGPITDRFRLLLRKLRLLRRQHGFYSLRRTFRTIADETLDFPACDLIMGHARKGTGDIYRQRISDDRLVGVGEHVRAWLFGSGGQADE